MVMLITIPAILNGAGSSYIIRLLPRIITIIMIIIMIIRMIIIMKLITMKGTGSSYIMIIMWCVDL